MTFDIFLNILIIALLCIGIVYAIVLEHRLSGAKEKQRELKLLMNQFYKATQKTAEELLRLKKIEEETRKALKTDMERAGVLRDELNFLVNKIQKMEWNKPSLNTPPVESIISNDRDLSREEEDLINALNALK